MLDLQPKYALCTKYKGKGKFGGGGKEGRKEG